jgi:hypothetical protein
MGLSATAWQAIWIALLVLAIVILAIILYLVVRRMFAPRMNLSGDGAQRGRRSRLGVIDTYDVDRQRRLILLRRDNVEHLVMIGGPNDVLVEATIRRAVQSQRSAVPPGQVAAQGPAPTPAYGQVAYSLPVLSVPDSVDVLRAVERRKAGVVLSEPLRRPSTRAALTIEDLSRQSPKRKVRSSSVEAPRPGGNLIDVSVFAPLRAAKGSEVLVQVFAHRIEELTRKIWEAAKAADPATAKRGLATLDLAIANGERLDFVLEGPPDFSIDEPRQSFIWNGRPRSCGFLVRVSAKFASSRAHLRVRVFRQAVPIGQLRFTLDVVESPIFDPNPISSAGESQKRYNSAFLSYASSDRAEVIKRAQALQVAQISFFQDLLSLEPGEHWEKRLFEEIEKSDLFLLFWSEAARKSEWVRREIDHALMCRRKSASESPEILPIVIEGPPPPKPPERLAHLHFDDPLCYLIAAAAPPLAS